MFRSRRTRTGYCSNQETKVQYVSTSIFPTRTCLHCPVLFPTLLRGQTKHKFSTVSMASHIQSIIDPQIEIQQIS